VIESKQPSSPSQTTLQTTNSVSANDDKNNNNAASSLPESATTPTLKEGTENNQMEHLKQLLPLKEVCERTLFSLDNSLAKTGKFLQDIYFDRVFQCVLDCLVEQSSRSSMISAKTTQLVQRCVVLSRTLALWLQKPHAHTSGDNGEGVTSEITKTRLASVVRSTSLFEQSPIVFLPTQITVGTEYTIGSAISATTAAGGTKDALFHYLCFVAEHLGPAHDELQELLFSDLFIYSYLERVEIEMEARRFPNSSSHHLLETGFSQKRVGLKKRVKFSPTLEAERVNTTTFLDHRGIVLNDTANSVVQQQEETTLAPTSLGTQAEHKKRLQFSSALYREIISTCILPFSNGIAANQNESSAEHRFFYPQNLLDDLSMQNLTRIAREEFDAIVAHQLSLHLAAITNVLRKFEKVPPQHIPHTLIYNSTLESHHSTQNRGETASFGSSSSTTATATSAVTTITTAAITNDINNTNAATIINTSMHTSQKQIQSLLLCIAYIYCNGETNHECGALQGAIQTHLVAKMNSENASILNSLVENIAKHTTVKFSVFSQVSTNAALLQLIRLASGLWTCLESKLQYPTIQTSAEPVVSENVFPLTELAEFEKMGQSEMEKLMRHQRVEMHRFFKAISTELTKNPKFVTLLFPHLVPLQNEDILALFREIPRNGAFHSVSPVQKSEYSIFSLTSIQYALEQWLGASSNGVGKKSDNFNLNHDAAIRTICQFAEENSKFSLFVQHAPGQHWIIRKKENRWKCTHKLTASQSGKTNEKIQGKTKKEFVSFLHSIISLPPPITATVASGDNKNFVYLAFPTPPHSMALLLATLAAEYEYNMDLYGKFCVFPTKLILQSALVTEENSFHSLSSTNSFASPSPSTEVVAPNSVSNGTDTSSGAKKQPFANGWHKKLKWNRQNFYSSLFNPTTTENTIKIPTLWKEFTFK
jgi:hypothetical protein